MEKHLGIQYRSAIYILDSQSFAHRHSFNHCLLPCLHQPFSGNQVTAHSTLTALGQYNSCSLIPPACLLAMRKAKPHSCSVKL